MKCDNQGTENCPNPGCAAACVEQVGEPHPSDSPLDLLVRFRRPEMERVVVERYYAYKCPECGFDYTGVRELYPLVICEQCQEQFVVVEDD